MCSKIYIGLHVKYRHSCKILIKPEFPQQIFKKYTNIIFHRNRSSDSRVVPCGRLEGRTHEEANSRILQFCERTYKFLFVCKIRK